MYRVFSHNINMTILVSLINPPGTEFYYVQMLSFVLIEKHAY